MRCRASRGSGFSALAADRLTAAPCGRHLLLNEVRGPYEDAWITNSNLHCPHALPKMHVMWMAGRCCLTIIILVNCGSALRFHCAPQAKAWADASWSSAPTSPQTLHFSLSTPHQSAHSTLDHLLPDKQGEATHRKDGCKYTALLTHCPLHCPLSLLPASCYPTSAPPLCHFRDINRRMEDAATEQNGFYGTGTYMEELKFMTIH